MRYSFHARWSSSSIVVFSVGGGAWVGGRTGVGAGAWLGGAWAELSEIGVHRKRRRQEAATRMGKLRHFTKVFLKSERLVLISISRGGVRPRLSGPLGYSARKKRRSTTETPELTTSRPGAAFVLVNRSVASLYSRGQFLSDLSLIFASWTVCHCMFAGTSAPPHSGGMIWSTTEPLRPFG